MSGPHDAASRAELERLAAALAAEHAARHDSETRLARLQTAYARFVPPQLVEALGKDSILDVACGNQAEQKMTLLFSDIRGFASLSERLSPQQCFDFINTYLSFMEPVVVAHGGFIDKYIGDAVMALFPARGDDALHAALDMLAALARFNATRPPDEPIRIGIGLNSGLLMLGAIGGRQRMEITVISDAVNLAARVETLTKTYQTPLLLTQHTLNSIRDPAPFSIRFIDRVRVRGKHLAQSIYEVFDADPPDLRAAKLASRELFEDALAHYHFHRRDAARALFGACLEHHADDRPAAIYWQRCRAAVPEAEAAESDGLAHWRPDYLLGDTALDIAHQDIFARIGALAQALREDRGTQAEQLAAQLGAALGEHFATEEGLMARHGYPRSPRAEHLQQHAKFSAFLAALAAEMGAGQSSLLRLAFRCQFLLLDWFISHVVVTDRHLSRFIATRPA